VSSELPTETPAVHSTSLPKKIAAGSVFALALGGLVVASVLGVGALTRPASSSASQPDAAVEEPIAPPADQASTGGAIKRAPADRINLCTGTLAEVAPSQSGLELTVHFDDTAAAGTEPIAGTVTLTNTGDQELTGYTAASPALTLSRDGIVLWHTNGAMIMSARDVNLAPGESLEYETSFTPVVCTVDDDLAELGFSPDLPAAEPGEYQLSALIDFMGDFDADLISGPTSTITLN